MFYIRESRAMLEFFLFTKEWPRYLQISDSAYGCSKICEYQSLPKVFDKERIN